MRIWEGNWDVLVETSAVSGQVCSLLRQGHRRWGRGVSSEFSRSSRNNRPGCSSGRTHAGPQAHSPVTGHVAVGTQTQAHLADQEAHRTNALHLGRPGAQGPVCGRHIINIWPTEHNCQPPSDSFGRLHVAVTHGCRAGLPQCGQHEREAVWQDADPYWEAGRTSPTTQMRATLSDQTTHKPPRRASRLPPLPNPSQPEAGSELPNYSGYLTPTTRSHP